MEITDVKGLHHICLPVADLARSSEYYEKVIGLKPLWTFVLQAEHAKVLFNINCDCRFAVYQCGDQGRLELFSAPDITINPGLGQHYCLVVNNRANIVNRLNESGYDIRSVIRENREIVFVTDPDGHLLELKPDE